MSTILDTIVAAKRREVAAARAAVPIRDLARRLGALPPVRGFEAALRQPGMQIIAEVKKASPSAGVLRGDFDAVAIAKIYEQHGAACISVLTDGPFFQGALSYLGQIRAAVRIPLLRKDFIIDSYQLLEARYAGADAVLLIAEILPGEELARLHQEARRLGLEVLVELHDKDQLNRVVDCGATIIGINNRDLHTFATRLDHTLDLAPSVPSDRCLVSESGIRSRVDLNRLACAGVKAVLVGETLMRAPDIGAELAALRDESRT